MKIEPIAVLLFVILPALLACEDEVKCKDQIYDKSSYSSVKCKHSQHRLVDRDKHWFCQCKGKVVVKAKARPSASASASAAAPSSEPKPAASTDYSWLDTDY